MAVWELEVRIGRPRFAEFMRRYMTDPVNTTPDLLDMLEEVAGREDRVWFEERLGRATP